jgi:hypothetical protein
MTAKKPAKKAPTKSAKVSAPKTKAKALGRVDIYPNRMSLAVSALAAVSLVLFALIALS